LQSSTQASPGGWSKSLPGFKAGCGNPHPPAFTERAADDTILPLMEGKPTSTLKLKWPFGTTLLLALTLALALIAALEILARQNFARAYLPTQGLGSGHRQFEIQLARARARAERDGHIDCILLGNSQVMRGIDPAVVEANYEQKTGESIRCQNFGVRGTSTQTSAIFAKILIAEFNPSVVIYGTSFIDFASSRGLEAHESIMGSPWIQYKIDRPNIEGWLIDQSMAYREYLGMQIALFPASPQVARDNRNSEQYIQANGFYPEVINTTRKKLLMPDDTDPDKLVSDIRVLIDESHLQAFDEILKLNEPGKHTIIVLEMPVNTEIYRTFPNFIKDQQAYIDMLVERQRLYGVPIWYSADILVKIPTDRWYDLLHLNAKGAELFSDWLGNRFAAAILDREITLHGDQ
jgi:hypothetical protein